MALALVLSALVFAPVSANALEPKTTTYVALGDSISFGYTQERFNNHYPTESPSYFEEGFTNGFAKDLSKSSELGKGVRLVNDACPGETSNGLIGENPLVLGEASTEGYAEIEQKPEEVYNLWYGGYQGLGDWHPCKYTYQSHLPLHNGGYISGGKEVSQLEEALASITSKTSEVKAITINIGSNDELAGITQCKDEVFYEYATKGKSEYGPSPESATVGCIEKASKEVLVPHIVKNLDDIIGVLEAGGYKGPIILLGFYNPDSFVLGGSDALQVGTNEAVEAYVVAAHPSNVTFANPFPVFNAGETAAKEQKSICKYTEMCNPNVQVAGGKPVGKDGDIHPTVAGYKALAKLVNEAYLANPAK
ncbi:MAG: SGNH/GDSL hydrolase family protein [Solirubrobacteraceae bacterium]